MTLRAAAERLVAEMDAARADHGEDDCWPWHGTLAKKGYAVFQVEGRQYRIGRLILGITEAGPNVQACHRCDNPPCVNPAHLFVGSAADNQRDKGVKGRAARGEANGGGGRLSALDVVAIRLALQEGEMTMTEIGAKYGISRTMVGRIRDKKAWAWL